MKLRVIILEADDVAGGDIEQVIQQVFRRELAGSGPVPALPGAPSVPTQIVPSAPGWRPQAKRQKRSDVSAATTAERVTTTEKLQCHNCGADKPEGLFHRAKCPKCLTVAWEKVPAHVDKAA